MFELVAGELPFGQDEDDDQAKLFAGTAAEFYRI